ncbi:lasso peptide biosynthesis B2 protein [Pectobacterium odoriferum]|uniref:lasso peptide biosynthesis B2 protein n=1 Tax=Pectobacterium odoriferum TaxID=78398 RepID=UPI00137380FF|nr:lasso peptide biosynthesis B2 protein [Pectobacterium odoriferum]QHP80219.1 lasso peptide biosynthesis B2 protein [Pectobacterium odoriferum]
MLRLAKHKNDIVILDIINDEFNIIEENDGGKEIYNSASNYLDIINKTNLELVNNYLICERRCGDVHYTGFLEERWFMPSPDVRRLVDVDIIYSFFRLFQCINITEEKSFLGIICDLHKVRLESKKSDTELNFDIIDKYKTHLEIIFPFFRKKSNCLTYSYFLAKRLIHHGMAAVVVVGIRTQPFYSHAWVEIDGKVINDECDIRDKLTVILVI